jgi:hypothetical protein
MARQREFECMQVKSMQEELGGRASFALTLERATCTFLMPACIGIDSHFTFFATVWHTPAV